MSGDIRYYKNFIVSICIIVLFAFVGSAINTNYSKQIQAVKKKRVELEEGKKLLAEWSSTTNEFNKVTASFLQKDTVNLKRFIEEKARTAELDIDNLTTDQDDQGYYWMAAIRLQATSYYENFLLFIRLLEEKRIIIENCRLTSSYKPGDSRERVNGTLSIKGIVIK